tara:strand:+ start:155 stop:679 length:525 start_codon:yes stop_codon:yes gene_type:complete
MKYLVKFFVITFLIFGINNVQAEIKIAYVDMDKILNESKAGSSVQKKLQKVHKENIKNFKSVEEKLKSKEKDILSKKNVMKKEEYDKKIIELRKEAAKYQTNRRKKLDALTKMRNDAKKSILENLQPVLTEYSEKNGISIIIDKRNIVLGKSELDVTKFIIDELNKKLPSLKLN